jgi:hypothetical protein
MVKELTRTTIHIPPRGEKVSSAEIARRKAALARAFEVRDSLRPMSVSVPGLLRELREGEETSE